MCDEALITDNTLPATETNDHVATDSQTLPKSKWKASCLHFPIFHLIRSGQNRLLKNAADRSNFLQECTQVPIETVGVVRLVVPLDTDKAIDLMDPQTGNPLLQVPWSDIVACIMGTAAQINRFLVFVVSTDLVTPAEDKDKPVPAADFFDLSVAGIILSPKHPTIFPHGLYGTYVVHAPSSYVATRLFRLVDEVLHGKIGKFGYPAAVPEYGSIRIRWVLDLQEEEKSGSEQDWRAVPKEKSNILKLRQRLSKRLVIAFTLYSGLQSVSIASCMNVSVTYGRYLREEELVWLGSGSKELVDEAASAQIPDATFLTFVDWPSDSPDFQVFEKLTSKDECIFFTIAVQILLTNLTRPLVLQRVCRARVFRQDELFWLMADRKPIAQDYMIHLSEFVDNEGTLFIGRFAEVVRVAPFPSAPVSVTSNESISPLEPYTEDGPELENGEPLASGQGVVSREISDDRMLKEWGDLISEWQTKMKTNSTLFTNGSLATPVTDVDGLYSGTIGPAIRNLNSTSLVQRIRRLVARGIPDALRAEAWQLLSSSAVKESDLMDVYRILVTKPCKHDDVIRRDLSRTFPAHDFFRENLGQEYLFQVGRAYALYDEEVGYCQGLSFFAAVLLLHMPVEQTFSLLIQVNNHYGLRELILHDFEGLHMRLYQLDRIVQDQLPELAKHFTELRVEAHMYANQWFLTLFTANFPLPLVCRVIDLFLAEGLIFIFKMAFAMLRVGRRDLLGLDFEGVLNYLRVTLPKRLVEPVAADELLTVAVTAKITPSRLRRYAKDWMAVKHCEKISPTIQLEQQVTALREQVNRLERENNTLASGLLTSKTSLHHELDKLEDKTDVLTRELFTARKDLQDALEENDHLRTEVAQVKQMLRETMQQTAREQTKSQQLISTYRAIASDLIQRSRLVTGRPNDDQSAMLYLRLLWWLLTQITSCDRCSPALEASVKSWKQDKNGSEGDEDFDSDEAVDAYLAKWMPDLSNISSSEANPVESDDQPASTSDTDRSSPNESRSKRWLAYTLNALRNMGLNESNMSRNGAT